VHPAASSPRVERTEAATGRRSWIVRAGAVAASTAVWTSRDGWLSSLRTWAHTRALGALCAGERVSITAATLLAIATVMAEHADHATGRHVAITRATVADRVGCDVRTVTAAWRVLRAAHWAIEAQRGHGSPTTPSIGRRPSVYHLVSRRRGKGDALDRTPAACGPVRTAPDPHAHEAGQAPQGGELGPGAEWGSLLLHHHTDSACHDRRSMTARQPGAPVQHFHLPPSGGVTLFPPVSSYSPSAQTRAENTQPTPRKCAHRRQPRPLAIQRLAGQLAAHCHGLHRGHIGALCDALTNTGIDPTLWSARALTDALDADMKQRRTTWPDHINNPGAFLAARLRRITWPPEGPPPQQGAGCAGAGHDNTAQAPVRPRNHAQSAIITQARRDIRAVLDAAALRRAARQMLASLHQQH
jgi:hypothetical protein